jgi:hypothetical protein
MSQISPVINLPLHMRASLHNFLTLENANFDTLEYSRLKFGSDRVAKKFGKEMADWFYVNHRNILVNNKCVVIPAPSTTVSVAATMLSKHFMDRVNSLLALEDQSPVEWTLIHRNMTYNNNYADLPKEERARLLAQDEIFINHKFVAGKFIIFIDDCTITGAHENKVSQFLIEEGLPNDHMFLFYAKYDGNIPATEGKLNHVEIKDAFDLVKLSHEKGHTITTRSLRLLLEHPTKDFRKLLALATQDFLEGSYYAAITKGYNMVYADNFNILRKYLKHV